METHPDAQEGPYKLLAATLAVAAPAGWFPGPSAVEGAYRAVPYAAMRVKKLQLEQNLKHGEGRSQEQHVPPWLECGQRHTPVWLPSGVGRAWKRPCRACVWRELLTFRFLVWVLVTPVCPACAAASRSTLTRCPLLECILHFSNISLKEGLVLKGVRGPRAGAGCPPPPTAAQRLGLESGVRDHVLLFPSHRLWRAVGAQ